MITAHTVGNILVSFVVNKFVGTKTIRFEWFISVFRWRCFIVD